MNATPPVSHPAIGAQTGAPMAVLALQACGWLQAPSDGCVPPTIDILCRAHTVTRVTAPDGRAAIVKHPTGGIGDGRDLARELFVYRLGRWKRELGAVMPEPILIDEARQLLAVEFVGDATAPWPQAFAATPLRTPEVAARLGRAMSAWHRDTLDVSLPPSPSPGILGVGEDVEAATQGRRPGVAHFLRHVAADPGFAGMLAEARALYEPSCLVHGDIRGDNWGLGDRLKLIDWEMAGAGDPAWDVAGALAEMALQGIRDGYGADPGGSGWPRAVERLGPALDYEPTSGLEALRARLLPFTAARLLHVASEWVDAAASFAPPGDFAAAGVAPIIAIVRGLIIAPRRLAPWNA